MSVLKDKAWWKIILDQLSLMENRWMSNQYKQNHHIA